MPLIAIWNQLTNWEIQNVPESEGVYELADYSKAVIYIGRSNNLKRRLNEHLNTSDPCLRSVQYFCYEKTWNSEQREQELLEEYRRIHGRLPKCNDLV